jgi:hypothetical protein
MILLFVLLFPFSAIAQTVITINVSNAPYSSVSAAQGVGVRDEFAVRVAAMSALAGKYKTLQGVFYTLKKGQIFEFKWQDGSKERGVVKEPAMSDGVWPVDNTQSRPPGGGIGYTTDPNGNFYGGGNVTGFRTITQTTTVCVGGYCESMTRVIGYEWIYGPGGRPNEVV